MPAQRRCGGDSDEVVAAANKERSVLLYASYNPVNMEELKKAFESECPAITLESVRGTDAELNPKPRSSGLTPGDVAEYTASVVRH